MKGFALMLARWGDSGVGIGMVATLFLVASSATAQTTLYDQNFENPVGYTNNGEDVDGNSVNNLYGNQPPGFLFQQVWTVETLNITGGNAFGSSGYVDDGTGGNFALGMLSSRQDDMLALTFNVGSFDFFNFRLDASSIDLTCCGGPFVPESPLPVPEWSFTLIDSPGAVFSFGNGTVTVLDTGMGTGTASPRDTFDWTEFIIPLSTNNNTDGNVTVVIDMLTGGYGALDNFLIVASNVEGDVGVGVPEPTTILLLGLGVAGLGFARRRHGRLTYRNSYQNSEHRQEDTRRP